MKRGAMALLATVLLGGCSLGADDESPRGPDRAEGAAASVVVRLDGLVRARRFEELCDNVLSPRARLRVGGAGCAKRMRARTAALTDPRVELLSVRHSEGGLRARVRVGSGGSAGGDRDVALVRIGSELRVDGLSR